MFRKLTSLSACAAMALTLGACDTSADISEGSSTVPATANSREDIEKIVEAYLLENPEIILEAMEVLSQRASQKAAEQLAGDPRDFSIGPEDAPVTIVEFFDYKCGYCRMSADWFIEQANNSDGQIRVVFKEFPILSEQSTEAALAALAAKEQGKYLEFHQALMKQTGDLTRERLLKIAGDMDLNTAKLEKAMDSDELKKHLSDIQQEARAFGVDATPTFYVNGEAISGFDRNKLEQRISDGLQG